MSEHSHYRGRFLEFLQRDRWEFVRRTNASAVVAIAALTLADEVILIEQERPTLGAAGQRVLELPAGLVGDDGNHDLLIAAQRELEEETGYRAAELRYIGAGPSSAGVTDEIISLVRATGCERVAEGGGVEGEDIQTHLIPRSEVRDWVAARSAEGMLVDPKVWAGLYVIG